MPKQQMPPQRGPAIDKGVSDVAKTIKNPQT